MSLSPVNNISKHTFKPNGFQKALVKASNLIPEKFSDFCDLTTKASMKRTTQFSILAICVLVGRYFQARNEDEKREILTRDTGMLLTAVYAVPIFKKIASFFINKNTGIPVAHGEKGFTKNLNPEKGIQMASYDQLKEWLSVKETNDFNNIKNGFAGFCRNIKKLGGDVIKCFDVLDKNSKEKINELAKLLGYKNEITNKNIITMFNKAQKSTDKNVQEKLEHLKKLFIHDKDKKIINPLLTKASHYKSIVEFCSIGAAAFILGGLLPWFNIQHTKKLYAQKNAEDAGLNLEATKTLPVNNANMIDKFKKFQESGQLR